MQHSRNLKKNSAYNFLVRSLYVLVILATILAPIQPTKLAFLSSSVAHAQFGGEGAAAGLGTDCPNGHMTMMGCQPGPGPNQQVKTTCDPTDWDTWSICISDIVYIFTAGIMSVFAYIGGVVFSMAVHFSLLSTAYSLNFLSSGWAAVRDIANILFIFILIYLSFIIMFGAETHGTNKMLATVLIMALLINFSFFFTRVVIDAGNILAVQFYNSIDAPSIQTSSRNSSLLAAGQGVGPQLAGAFSSSNTKDLTGSIMNLVGATDMFNTSEFQHFANNNGFLAKTITLSLIYVLLGIIFGILASTFFFVGFKFIYRVIALWFVIIFSPLAFVARGLTNNATARTFYKMWQNMLLQFAFYPAIFLFIFLLIWYFTKSLAGSGSILQQAFQYNIPGNVTESVYWISMGELVATIGLKLGVIIIMMYFGLRISDEIVKQGNNAAERVTGWAGRTLGGATYGLIGYGARNSIGYASRKYAPTAQKNASTATGTMSKLWYSGVNSMNKQVAQSSFDARGTGLRQLTLKSSRFDIGKAPNKKAWVKNPSPSLSQRIKSGFGPKFDQKKLDKIDADVKKQQARAQQQAQRETDRVNAKAFAQAGALNRVAQREQTVRNASALGNISSNSGSRPAPAPLSGDAVVATPPAAPAPEVRDEVAERIRQNSESRSALREARYKPPVTPAAPAPEVRDEVAERIRQNSESRSALREARYKPPVTPAAPAPEVRDEVAERIRQNSESRSALREARYKPPVTPAAPAPEVRDEVAERIRQNSESRSALREARFAQQSNTSNPAQDNNPPGNNPPPAAPAAARPAAPASEPDVAASNSNASVSDEKIAASGNPLTSEPERTVPPQEEPEHESSMIQSTSSAAPSTTHSSTPTSAASTQSALGEKWNETMAEEKRKMETEERQRQNAELRKALREMRLDDAERRSKDIEKGSTEATKLGKQETSAPDTHTGGGEGDLPKAA